MMRRLTTSELNRPEVGSPCAADAGDSLHELAGLSGLYQATESAGWNSRVLLECSREVTLIRETGLKSDPCQRSICRGELSNGPFESQPSSERADRFPVVFSKGARQMHRVNICLTGEILDRDSVSVSGPDHVLDPVEPGGR